MRRAEVEVSLDEPVPLTLLTSDETLRLMLDGPPAISLDAVATEGGSIRAEDFDLPHQERRRRAALQHSVRRRQLAAARDVAQPFAADIVIRKAK